MACGCSKAKTLTNCKYIYTDSNGVQSVYTSEIRAMAAKLRDGNTGSVRMEC